MADPFFLIGLLLVLVVGFGAIVFFLRKLKFLQVLKKKKKPFVISNASTVIIDLQTGR